MFKGLGVRLIQLFAYTMATMLEYCFTAKYTEIIKQPWESH